MMRCNVMLLRTAHCSSANSRTEPENTGHDGGTDAQRRTSIMLVSVATLSRAAFEGEGRTLRPTGRSESIGRTSDRVPSHAIT